MFLELGVLLSSVFTTNAIYGTAPSFTSQNNGYLQTCSYGAIGPLQYLLTQSTFTNDDNKIGDNEYECELFSLDINDNDRIFRDYINVRVNWDIILVNNGHSQQASNISLSLEYMDYDYEFPFLNFYTRAYYTYDNGTNKTYFDENDYHQLWIGETWSYVDLDNNDVAPIKICLEFHWVPLDLYDNALLGAYPGPTSIPQDVIDDATYKGYTKGYDDGSAFGTRTGYDAGYTNGYNQGWADSNNNSYTFTTLFGAIADTPIYILHSLLGFEVFGVQAINILMTMLTGCIAIYLIRKII